MKKIEIEHLIATTGKKITGLCDRMNIECNAVMAVQSKKTYQKTIENKNNIIKVISTNTKGVGFNRNIGILYSSADICILSDDDMHYINNYQDVILEAFEKIPKADIIIFNIETKGNSERKRRKNTKIKKINSLNYMNYGAARIVFKRNSIIKNNIYFNTEFGGGAKYSSGEDTVFLNDAIKNGLKIYTYPKTIAEVDERESSWFRGYNDKFFYDKGALLARIHPLTKYLYGLIYFPIRFKSQIGLRKKQELILKGIRNYQKGIDYEEYIKMEKK